MMNLTTTLLFYVLIGGGVAVALFQRAGNGCVRESLFRSLTAIAFWPLYLPALLQPGAGENFAGEPATSTDTSELGPAPDEIGETIRQVEAELDLALCSLDGWSDSLLAREQHRFAELRTAWHAQADRIRELDCLLAQPAFETTRQMPLATIHDERARASEEARQANIARLRNVREHLYGDLVNTLASVRQLVTMIHLAKYTGAPASRAEELVLQIATSIEGLSEVAAWQDEEQAAAVA
jgi:hypothetical protein